MARERDRAKSLMATGPMIGCIKTLLTIFNFIFWVTGVAILVLGIWTIAGLQKYFELTSDYPEVTPYVLIGLGAALTIVASVGCCCTIKGYGRLLYLYSIFLFIVFIAMLSAGIAFLVFKGKLQEGFKNGLTDALAKYSTDADKKTAVDDLQTHFHCCGVDSFADWFTNSTKEVPVSCCRNQQQCVRKDQTKNSTQIWTEGCHTKIVEGMESNIGIIGGSALGFAFLQLIGSFLACMLGKGVNKSKYEQVA